MDTSPIVHVCGQGISVLIASCKNDIPNGVVTFLEPLTHSL